MWQRCYDALNHVVLDVCLNYISTHTVLPLAAMHLHSVFFLASLTRNGPRQWIRGKIQAVLCASIILKAAFQPCFVSESVLYQMNSVIPGGPSLSTRKVQPQISGFVACYSKRSCSRETLSLPEVDIPRIRNSHYEGAKHSHFDVHDQAIER